MKLIAKKPCSFGGKAFFINDEIPVNAVLNPKQQEELGAVSYTHLTLPTTSRV